MRIWYLLREFALRNARRIILLSALIWIATFVVMPPMFHSILLSSQGRPDPPYPSVDEFRLLWSPTLFVGLVWLIPPAWHHPRVFCIVGIVARCLAVGVAAVPLAALVGAWVCQVLLPVAMVDGIMGPLSFGILGPFLLLFVACFTVVPSLLAVRELRRSGLKLGLDPRHGWK